VAKLQGVFAENLVWIRVFAHFRSRATQLRARFAQFESVRRLYLSARAVAFRGIAGFSAQHV
jgi:hypothetical protein